MCSALSRLSSPRHIDIYAGGSGMRVLASRRNGCFGWPSLEQLPARGCRASAADSMIRPVAPAKVRAGAALVHPRSYGRAIARQSSRVSACLR